MTKPTKKIVRTYTATRAELRMLDALAQYHGFSKSATITSLIKKEFWRVFPAGTVDVPTQPGARIAGAGIAGAGGLAERQEDEL